MLQVIGVGLVLLWRDQQGKNDKFSFKLDET